MVDSDEPTLISGNRRARRGHARRRDVGGMTWRAVEGGVFATGTGPAYASWDQSRPSVQGAAMGMMSAAVLAATAHNAQPWHFRVATSRIDLSADTSRGIGTDPLGCEIHVLLGCALENLTLAGPANVKALTVSLRGVVTFAMTWQNGQLGCGRFVD
jgi:hypothetical protein